MEDYPVIIDESAREDIGSVVDWLAEFAPHKIGEWLDNLEEDLSSLSRMPERCPLAPENGKWGGGMR